MLAVHELYTGNHQAEWMGIPATGRHNESLGLIILEFEGSQAARETQYWDPYGMMVNLGVMPPPDLTGLTPTVTLPAPAPTGLSALAAEAEAQRRWGIHDMASYSQVIREDAQLLVNGLALDRSGYVAMQELYVVAFPDLAMDVVRSQDMGDNWVLNEAVFTGTHQGPHFGVPASGVHMVNRVAWVSRYDEQGLMSYASFHFDNLGC